MIKNTNRYSVPSDEDFEPKSHNEVLKNFLNVKIKSDIEQIEQRELERTELELLKIYDNKHRFTIEDICNIHELWLGDIYPMAGKYRTVNMEKDGFPFAAPTQIEKLMKKLEKYLAEYTPCNILDPNELAYALGLIHVEFILIHPFREGNGRTARLLADLMAIQANKPPLNYELIGQTKNQQGFDKYIKAIHAGLLGDYEPIKNIFSLLLEKSI